MPLTSHTGICAVIILLVEGRAEAKIGFCQPSLTSRKEIELATDIGMKPKNKPLTLFAALCMIILITIFLYKLGPALSTLLTNCKVLIGTVYRLVSFSNPSVWMNIAGRHIAEKGPLVLNNLTEIKLSMHFSAPKIWWI